MGEWKEYKLGEIAIFCNNKISAKEVDSKTYISTENMLPEKRGITEASSFPCTGNYTLYKKEDILLSNIRPYFKKIWYANRTGSCSNDVLCIISNKEYTHSKYLYYLLSQDDFFDYVMLGSKGCKMPRGDKSHILNWNFVLPSLPIQKEIANILSSLDDKIDLLNRQNATLEAMAETLFRHYFIDNAKEDWKEGKLGDLIVPKKGKNITKVQVSNGIYPVVAGGLEPSCFHNECNTLSPVITISSSGANAGFVRLYSTAVWSSDSSYIDYTVTNYIYFIYVFLKMQQNVLFDKQEGSAQPHIYPSHIMDLYLLLPDLELIGEFEKEMMNLFEKIKNNQQQIQTLTKLRDTLLPKLMSGELKVRIN